QGLRGLAGGKDCRQGAEAGRFQRPQRRGRVRTHVLVADDEGQGAGAARAGERAEPGPVVAGHADVVAALAEPHLDRGHGRMPSSRPTSVKAATARSICSGVWAADIWMRMRAWPWGTTG